jgi:predicted metal-dependent peptidase
LELREESALRQLYADPAGAARQARDKLAAARVWLMKHKPFFGVLARALKLEATLEVPAYRLLPDDRLLFHPVLVLQASFPSACARLAHLALHAVLGAHGRRRAREPRRWNVAHDLAIAPLLAAAELSVGATTELGLQLPPGASAEQYYDALPEAAAPDRLWCDLSDAHDESRAPPAGNYRQEMGGGDEPGDDAGAGPGPASPLSSPHDALSADERGRELMWKMRLAAAYEEEVASGGKTFGDIPGWLDELVRATIEPPADWSAVLQQAVSSLKRSERCYLRPSRRMSALVGPDGEWPELVSMPGRRVEQAGQLCVVIDTSASITTASLARFLGVVAAAATAEGIDDVRLIQADAAITSDRTLFAAELLFTEVAMSGRGGTDFGPALRALDGDARRQANRHTVVYLTDLDGRFPPVDDVRWLDVLWIVPARVASSPPFGRVLELTQPPGEG